MINSEKKRNTFFSRLDGLRYVSALSLHAARDIAVYVTRFAKEHIANAYQAPSQEQGRMRIRPHVIVALDGLKKACTAYEPPTPQDLRFKFVPLVDDLKTTPGIPIHAAITGYGKPLYFLNTGEELSHAQVLQALGWWRTVSCPTTSGLVDSLKSTPPRVKSLEDLLAATSQNFPIQHLHSSHGFVYRRGRMLYPISRELAQECTDAALEYKVPKDQRSVVAKIMEKDSHFANFLLMSTQQTQMLLERRKAFTTPRADINFPIENNIS